MSLVYFKSGIQGPEVAKSGIYFTNKKTISTGIYKSLISRRKPKKNCRYQCDTTR